MIYFLLVCYMSVRLSLLLVVLPLHQCSYSGVKSIVSRCKSILSTNILYACANVSWRKSKYCLTKFLCCIPTTETNLITTLVSADIARLCYLKFYGRWMIRIGMAPNLARNANVSPNPVPTLPACQLYIQPGRGYCRSCHFCCQELHAWMDL